MPSLQRGSVRKRDRGWQARFYDEENVRRHVGGFMTRTAAIEWLDAKLDEISALRRGDVLPVRDRPDTVDDLLDVFLEKHGRTVNVATKRKLTAQLRRARAEFGDRHPDRLRRIELEDWRTTLPAGSRPDVFRAFRQALTWALERGLVERDATAGIKNPKRKRHEREPIIPFESWAQIEAVADELDDRYRAIPILAAGTGLRPEEWLALEHGDIDREKRLVHVRRRFTGGQLKEGGKTPASVRAVPLRQVVVNALDAMPAAKVRRIGLPQILFPAPRGGYVNLERFRWRNWRPALVAAGLDVRGPYTCRHTFATWAIEQNVPLPHLATVMGTSVRELEDTYHRWLERTDEQLLAAFDAYDQKEAAHA